MDPKSFFTWDKPRVLFDIRPKEVFLKGSMEGAISYPIVGQHQIYDFLNNEQILNSGNPVHIIDLDGEMARELSKFIPLIILEGGYKNFKFWRDKAFEAGPSLNVLAGYTGSGKTELLQFLHKNGHQIIDLESLAVHRGSVFGKIRNKNQVLHENFQNKLLEEWFSLNDQNPVWIEEKGPFLGKAGLPVSLQKKMRNSTLYHLEVPFDERLPYLIKVYGEFEPSEFKTAIQKLESRMGTSNVHRALHFYETGQLKECFELLLNYYDKAYAQRREMGWKGKLVHISHSHENPRATLKRIEKL